MSIGMKCNARGIQGFVGVETVPLRHPRCLRVAVIQEH